MTENLKIYQTKQNIFRYLSDQQLSVGLSMYIIKDILQELQELYPKAVQRQINSLKKQEELKKEEELKNSSSQSSQFQFDPNSTISEITPIEDQIN